jgi:hypothetical protein
VVEADEGQLVEQCPLVLEEWKRATQSLVSRNCCVMQAIGAFLVRPREQADARRPRKHTYCCKGKRKKEQVEKKRKKEKKKKKVERKKPFLSYRSTRNNFWCLLFNLIKFHESCPFLSLFFLFFLFPQQRRHQVI